MTTEQTNDERKDSFEMTFGTPSKGSQVCIKIYYDSANFDDSIQRIENALKIRTMLMKLNIIL